MLSLLLAWRNLQGRPLQSFLQIGVVALAAALSLIVLLLASGLQRGLVQATEPFDLLVGAKGSPNQLVLNSVFLQDVPLGNIPYHYVDELAAHPAVAAAVPLGFGDNYRGFRLVGTEPAFFSVLQRPGGKPWLTLHSGRIFAADGEAVVGWKAAQAAGLQLGSQFVSAHGIVGGGHEHQQQGFTVVGILAPLDGPYDQAILVSLSSLWALHEHQHETETAQAEPEEDGAAERGTTVIAVKPKGYAEALRLYQELQQSPQLQIVFPAQVIVRLFQMLGQGEKVLQAVAAVVSVLSLLLVGFSLYWAARERTRERAILRVTGATRRQVLQSILLEGALLIGGGVASGTVGGWLAFVGLSHWLAAHTAVLLPVVWQWSTLAALLGIALAGLLASLWPAWLIGRQSAVRYLTS